ncbi:GATA transcription factor 4 [Lolium perenne]|uniref:GATA transcription factor 4 n=1 Tax=Lolium perenne TaxID=4522 RepID=UPI0021F55843|nr:GATA transcription factor 2-like [Lolium perenne]
MAAEWEAALGMELGMGTHYHHAPPPASSQMNHHHHAAFSHSHSQPHHYHFYGAPSAPTGGEDHMRVDEMLDLSSHLGAHDFFPGAAGNGNGGSHYHVKSEAPPTPPATAPASSFNLSSYADEFYLPVPTEEAAELEWLSNFVDDSYPDIPNYPPAMQAAMAAAARNGGGRQPAAGQDNSASAAPGARGARSKRSRAASAAAAAWHALAPRQTISPSSSSSSSDLSSSKPARSLGGGGGMKKSGLTVEVGGRENANVGEDGGVRRCTHCASDKTPQWRTGPLGPKTLCNACGVRYKSGRLVPEYRPAASPTFVLTQHSNSHRKVMELRRQNELVHIRGGGGGIVSASSGQNGGGGSAEHMFRDYGVC